MKNFNLKLALASLILTTHFTSVLLNSKEGTKSNHCHCSCNKNHKETETLSLENLLKLTRSSKRAPQLTKENLKNIETEFNEKYNNTHQTTKKSSWFSFSSSTYKSLNLSSKEQMEIQLLFELLKQQKEIDSFKFNVGQDNGGRWNIGHGNMGNNNVGNCNSGNDNVGNYNSGNKNTGNYNKGDHNTGNYNVGDNNTGNNNDGNNNVGNYNTGDKNVGNYNSTDENFGNNNEQESTYNLKYFNQKSHPKHKKLKPNK